MGKEYVCPYCDHMFVVSTIKNAMAKRTNEGKELTCPRCKKTNYYKD